MTKIIITINVNAETKVTLSQKIAQNQAQKENQQKEHCKKSKKMEHK